MQCSSAQKLQKEASFKTDKAYYQSWVAGVRGGGSGINVFIPVTSELNDLKLDSLYFRGQKVALTTKPNNPNLFIGRILTKGNQKEDYTSETDKIPFDLNPNDAVISYTENGTIKYFKIENLVEKQAQQYPSAPPRNKN
ncbi:hypothetical protein [Olleya sp. R77988]|uniref:hypothetical protein n=1 Tax=Olleya sp. R77988 TaxID=3093875 RepID=UPI0037CAD826